MKEVGLVGRIGKGNLVVDVDREPSGHFTFTALNEDSLPLAVELGHLQAMSFRNFSMGGQVHSSAEEKWIALLRELKVQEKSRK